MVESRNASKQPGINMSRPHVCRKPRSFKALCTCALWPPITFDFLAQDALNPEVGLIAAPRRV